MIERQSLQFSKGTANLSASARLADIADSSSTITARFSESTITLYLFCRNRFRLVFQRGVQVCQAKVAHFTLAGYSRTPANTASFPIAPD